MTALLGIDVGTTNIKVRIYSIRGEILGEKIFPTPLDADRHGGFYNPGKIVDAIARQIASFDPSLKRDVVALGVSSFAETMVGVDKRGKPVGECLAWFDSRTEAQFEKLKTKLDAGEIHSNTGLIPHHIYSFYKLRWFRENHRTTSNLVKCWTSMSGFVLFAFCGEMSFDYSLASRTMLFHQRKGCWWEKMLELAEVSSEQMARLVPSGTVLGEIKSEVFKKTGLPSGVLVVTGGHDHPCAALATGVFHGGSALISSGTTESVTMGLEEIPRKNARMRMPFLWGRHAAPRFYAINGMYSGGFSLDWILRIVGENYDRFGKLPLPKAKNIPLFFPYLRGSDYEGAKGSFFNLDGDVDREQMLQGLVIGLCFELRGFWEAMQDALVVPVKRVVNAGGGSRNAYWMKVKATVLGCDIIVPEDREGSTKGAALLAGIGSGVYRDADDAYKTTFRQDRVYKPVKKMRAWFDKRYRLYCDLREDLRKINMKIHNTIQET
jgi:xylulokinase